MARSNEAILPVLTPDKCQIVIEQRTHATRIARSLLTRWNVYLDPAESQGIADMALCEAAKNFSVERGTNFTTYLFPYIKGALIREIRARRRCGALIASVVEKKQVAIEGFASGNSSDSAYEAATDDSLSPEYQVYRKELRHLFRLALKTLKPLERETVIEINLREVTVAGLARRRGMSRPYLSSLHSKTIKKLQPFFDQAA